MPEQPLIYLNNAATTWPKPPEVTKAVQEALSLPAFGTGRTAGTEGTDYVSLAREKTAQLFNADEAEICFTHNATDALNLLIRGFIEKHPHCHVLTTALDHNSVLRPLHEFAKRGDITLSVIPIDKKTGTISPKAAADAVTDETKLMVMNHAGNVTGAVQDVRETARLLHKEDIFLIADGSQSAGHIRCDLKSLGADAFVFTGHKALFGITGTGGFRIQESRAEEIAPVRFGGTGTLSGSLYQPREMPERFEAGTQNFTGLAALAAGISYIEKRGIDAIHEQGMRQSAFLISELKEEENIVIHNEHPKVPVISFAIDGLCPDDIGFILSRKYGVVTRTGLHCAPLVHEAIDGGRGSVRMSLSALTTDEECEAAAAAVREVAERAASSVRSA